MPKPGRPPPKVIWSEEYWLHRAHEARALQSETINPECRRIMGEIAESFDRLAKLTKEFRDAPRPQKNPR